MLRKCKRKKTTVVIFLILFILPMVASCVQLFTSNVDDPEDPQVVTPTEGTAILLRHSTGGYLFNYGLRDHNANDGVYNPSPGVGDDFSSYNSSNGTNYQIQKRAFPGSGYSWDNYPYDYWEIFVNHGNDLTYSGQDTLKTLTQNFEVIIWKHCYPGSEILDDLGTPNVASNRKSLENYMMQYLALKAEMLKYPDTKFIVWTLALETESSMNATYRTNSKAFVDWVRNTWDEPGDNIFLWDLYYLQTNKEAAQYLLYPTNSGDSHPSEDFNNTAGPLFAQRVIDVIRGEGDSKPSTGESTLGGDWNLTP